MIFSAAPSTPARHLLLKVIRGNLYTPPPGSYTEVGKEACLPTAEKKTERRNVGSTNLGILFHETIIQVVPLIPATLRTRKTNGQSKRVSIKIWGHSSRQRAWPPKEMVM